MTRLTLIVLLGAFAAIAGCTDTHHYPLSGQECEPDDPVLEMDANDCTPPV